MKNSKSFNSVIVILKALAENGTLKPEHRKDIVKLTRHLRQVLRKGSHKEGLIAVDQIARMVVKIINPRQE